MPEADFRKQLTSLYKDHGTWVYPCAKCGKLEHLAPSELSDFEPDEHMCGDSENCIN